MYFVNEPTNTNPERAASHKAFREWYRSKDTYPVCSQQVPEVFSNSTGKSVPNKEKAVADKRKTPEDKEKVADQEKGKKKRANKEKSQKQQAAKEKTIQEAI